MLSLFIYQAVSIMLGWLIKLQRLGAKNDLDGVMTEGCISMASKLVSFTIGTWKLLPLTSNESTLLGGKLKNGQLSSSWNLMRPNYPKLCWSITLTKLPKKIESTYASILQRRDITRKTSNEIKMTQSI